MPLTQAEIQAHGAKGATGMSIAVDRRELALVVWHSVGPVGELRAPCSDVVALPRAWRILVAPVDPSGKAGSLVEFATGVNMTVFEGPMGGEGCKATSAPRASVGNGLIAYAFDNPTSGQPYGSRILVRSLADGSTLRDLATPTRVLALELSGSSVAWLEADGKWPKTLPLRISTQAQPGAQDIEVFNTPGDQTAWSLPRFSLDGNDLAWERYGTGEVWIRGIGVGTQQQVSPTGAVCLLGGIDTGNVAMNCGSDAGRLVQNVTDAPWLVAWSAQSGARLVVGFPPVQTEGISNGWIIVVLRDGRSAQAFRVDSVTRR